MDLGGVAIAEALARAGVPAERVDYVIMGQVLQAGQGRSPRGRPRSPGGVPKEVPAITINKVCLSGTSAIAMADQMIRAGEIDVAVAGGMESMTNAPYVLPKAREGSRMGDAELVDSMIHDGLWSTFTDQHMGESSDEISAELGISREDQDAWAARSHQRAHGGLGVRAGSPRRSCRSRSRSAGATPWSSTATRGSAPTPPRRSLAELKPAFATTAPSPRATRRRSPTAPPPSSWRARRRPRSSASRRSRRSSRTACGPTATPYLQTVPALALQKALKRAGLTATTSALLEINEAFAAVPLHAARMLGVGRGHRERERRRGGARPPDRRQRGPPRAHARVRDAPARRRPRGRGDLRRRRPGGRADPAADRRRRPSSGHDRRFELPEELEEFRALVRQIAEEQIAPRAAEIDEADEWPEDVYKVFVENDLMGVGYPEEDGGSGGGALAFGVLIEEISRVSAGVSLTPLVSKLGVIPLMLAGTDEQRHELCGGHLPRRAS